jgi:glycosyltransferase involved in cell wall biosynthesis
MGPIFERAHLVQIYQRASLFVYPSLAEFGETFGLAPLEAMANGCPPLVSNLACFRDYLKEEINGFVFDQRAIDPVAALADRIKACISNQERLERFGENARMTAQEFTVARVGRKYLSDFDSLIRSS